MKRVLIAVLAFFIMLPTVWAQEKEKTTTELKAEIASLQSRLNDQQEKDEQFVSKFAGFGKELGATMNSFVEAMDGGMKVTTTRVNEFAKTDVGRFAMAAIAWKIFADDFIALGQSAFNKTAGFVFLFTFCWLLKRTIDVVCWGRMVVTKKEGPWYARKVTKERTVPLIKDGTCNDITWMFAVVSGIALIVLFVAAAVGLTH